MLGVAASILAAWIMYKVLESPSVDLARRVRLPVVPARI